MSPWNRCVRPAAFFLVTVTRALLYSFSPPRCVFPPGVSSCHCLVAVLRRADAVQRANVTEARSVSSFRSSPPFLCLNSNSLRAVVQSYVSLSSSLSPQPWIQFQSFMGLSEMYKWRGSILSISLCLFSSGECHILTLSKVPLLQSWSKLPFIFSSFLVCPNFPCLLLSLYLFIASLLLTAHRSVSLAGLAVCEHACP